MSNNGPFGIDPEDLERAIADATAQLRGAFDFANGLVEKSKDGSLLSGLLDGLLAGGRPSVWDQATRRHEGGTAQENGSGVWVIYTLDGDGSARVEQVYATEIEALRANKDNTDAARKVRFLPYGVTIGVLDAS
ncbi:hypothetical protein [Smaragdicoccus niigatensis]|uniref:hypothetical protein n=1 Tax=Smaragdicoccus niigatensis TaxID=359359 RepID=UPI00035EA525|nr:hypothetical protein [Smaragdicoccus niigatensis]